MRRFTRIAVALILLLALLLSVTYMNHLIHLREESELLVRIGKSVEIDGHKMNVYVEGTGDKTLVFMSGGGTCSPVLDFKSLYSLLSDDYRIAVVEKFGYGFSDVVEKDRSIDSMLHDTRTALEMAGITGPYVLCPHSMSGIEALYWAQRYPNEVEAIIGLDMSVPEAYEEYKFNMPLIELGHFAAQSGIIRLLPGVSESEASKYGTLTDKEKKIYKAVFYSRSSTSTMINEVRTVKENARKVQANSIPQVPILIFGSNGEAQVGMPMIG